MTDGAACTASGDQDPCLSSTMAADDNGRMMPNRSIGGVCRLGDRGVIRARGADAATFLQGQLTNDVAHARRTARRAWPASARPRDACRRASSSGGGRATSSCWPARPSILAPTLKRLSMFVLRAKCKLERRERRARTLRRRRRGGRRLARRRRRRGHDARARRGATVVACPMPPACGAPSSSRRPAADVDVAGAPALSLDTWRWLEVQSGIVTIEAATVDRFVPQMVNFELVGGVDFQKGCYPGQEVVARSQYRGTTKRRTFLFDCDDDAGRRPGRLRRRRRRRSPPARSPTRRRVPTARAAARSSRSGSPRSAGDDAAPRRADGPRLHRAELPLRASRSRPSADDVSGACVRELFVWYRVAPRARRGGAHRGRRDAARACRRPSPGLRARLLTSATTAAARRPGWRPTRVRRRAATASRHRRARSKRAIAAAARRSTR